MRVRIGRLQPFRGHRIQGREPRVQDRRGYALGLRPDARPHRLRNGRDLGQALGQRLEEQAGAADHDRHGARGPRGGQFDLDLGQPERDRIGQGRVAMAVERVRGAGEVGRGRPARQDRQVAVDRHRIGVDDGPAEPRARLQRELRLAARRRACDEDRRLQRSRPDVVVS